MKYFEKFYMEDVHSVALVGIDSVIKELEQMGIELSEDQEDKIYIALDSSLEELSNGNYRHEH